MSPRLIALMAVICVGGCMSGRAQRVYALAEAAHAPVEKGDAAAPVLQIRRVLVPDYLDTTDILTRIGQHELHASSSGRWGERLSLGLTHALRADLAVRLPLVAVMLAPPPGKSDREVLVAVDALDVWPDGRCVLVANWTVVDRNGRSVVTAGGGTFGTPPMRTVDPGDAAIVTAMADALAQLADSIALSAAVQSPPQ
ncbi:MAG: hypothetical protein JWN43_440 [Gammaproteobacteria bacterium]|nr:hypothetical protein [Gammaproteobacteria bacterium]